MTPELHWPAIVLRLILTLLAGALLGVDRSRNGHPAGLRTVMLVTLAASVAMIQMNLLLPTSGKTSISFATMDVMRLPLGILTGVGFIGAGAILRKGDMVTLVGFGSFYVGRRSPRSGRNPRTGASIRIKAAKVPKFRAGKALKDALN